MEYTFENSFCTLLNEEGRKLIDEQLEKLRCHQCGTPVYRITFFEGDAIYCKSKPPFTENWHDTGFEVDVDSNPPRVIASETKKEEVTK